MRTIIAISGKQRSGKDTLCARLLEKLPDYRRVGLADQLKLEWAKQHLAGEGLLSPGYRDYDEMGDAEIIEVVDSLKNTRPNVRTALIDYGQAKKVGNPYHWIDLALSNPGNLIIPDVRYQCEVDRILERAGQTGGETLLVRLNANHGVRSQRGTLSNEDSPSETELDLYDGWHLVLNNNVPADMEFAVWDITTGPWL